MIRSVVQRSTSGTFRRSFALILIAEAVTILVAWFLLGINVNRWIHGKTVQAIQISQQAASGADWSLVHKVPKDQDSALGDLYQSRLYKISHRHFLRNEGSVYLAYIERGEEYAITPAGQPPIVDGGKANRWEHEAYATRKTSYTPVPISDDSGTYIAAYTPILHNGKVIGLVGAEYDSAPLADFQGLVRTAFWLSIIPAIAISLVVAYILASMFVEPMDVFRTIEETAKNRLNSPLQNENDDLWNRMTLRQKELAELVRRGLKNEEIAEELSVTPETVKQHLKNIKDKTGWSKLDLAVQAASRRAAPFSL
jgi:DNA-binding CsgD family transcriptional regulator